MTRWKREQLYPVIREQIDGMRGDRYYRFGSDHIFWTLSECAWMRGRMRALYDTGYGHYAYERYSCDHHNMLLDLRAVPPVPLP